VNSLEPFSPKANRPAPSTIEPGVEYGRRFVLLLRRRLAERWSSGQALFSAAELEGAFGKDTPWLAAARRHLEVADALRQHPVHGDAGEDAIRSAVRATGWSRGFVRDLARELHVELPDLTPSADGMLTGLWRGATSAPQVMTALLVQDAAAEKLGVVASLALERVREGHGEFHPVPTHGFLSLDADWLAACRAVQQALGALLRPDEDLRWSLHCHHGLPPILRGHSAALALALLAGRLLGKELPWTLLETGGAAASASLTADGKIGSVGFLPEKLVAAAQDFTLRPGFVVVAETALERIHADPRFRDFKRDGPALHWPGHDFTILGTKTLTEAATLLNEHRNRRFPGANAATDPGRKRAPLLPDYVHRPEPAPFLHATIAAMRAAGRTSGSLVLIGTAGSGKTTWLRAVLEGEMRAGQHPIYYLVGHRSETPRSQLGQSLYFQLREKYGLPDVAGFGDARGEFDPWPTRLDLLLRAVSERLPRDAAGRVEPAILYIEAADQLRHSEADRLLSGLFKPQLPDGIWLVITCRPDTHFLDSITEVARFEFLTLEPIADRPDDPAPPPAGAALTAYRGVVREFLVAGNRRLREPLREEFIARIFAEEQTCPLFKTVRDRLDALDPASGRLSDEAESRRLRDEVAPWLVEAHERALEEAHRYTDLVRARFGPDSDRAA
jgi:hypothetical protein